MTPPPRVASVVLAGADGRVLGVLPPFQADTPWWMDMAPLVQAVRQRHGLEVTVLRLLQAELPAAHGGAVTYLAQVDADAAPKGLAPWAGTLAEDPMRQRWAQPGGPQADLDWARQALAGCGLQPGGAAEQVRSWHLSSLWRLPLAGGGLAWLKSVPPFMQHEGRVLALLQGASVPRLLAHDGAGRVLLADVPGDDLYDAGLAQREAMIRLTVGLQAAWAGRADELLRHGLPDWRGAALVPALRSLLQRRGGELPAVDLQQLQAFVAELPARLQALAGCGLPDTLVHGDVHGGNFRGRGHALVLLDWGDSGVGHPLLDLPGFVDRGPPALAAALREQWRAAWQQRLPHADVARADALLAPLATARKALVYQRFLDHIEANEHPYHRLDVPDALQQAARQLRAAG